MQPPRWLRFWSRFTLGIAAVAMLSGTVVTTFQIGMADPVWPTYPWHLALIDWSEPKPGYVIEHLHRLADYALGLCILVLTYGLWTAPATRAFRWLGVACLVGVLFQGLLGGLRVVLNALAGTNLAFLHGVFAQVVFVTLAVAALFLTPAWSWPLDCVAEDERRRLRKLAARLAEFTLVQVVLGGLVRHFGSPLAQRLHVLAAFAVVGAAVWLAASLYRQAAADERLGQLAALLLGAVALQVVLGVEAWMGKFASPLPPPELQRATVSQAVIRALHYLGGSAVFAAGVAAVVLTRRPVTVVPVPENELATEAVA